MPRRPPLTPLLLLALSAACSSSGGGSGSGGGGAGGPVAVPAPSPASPQVVAACRALTGALPSSLDKGVDRRAVTGSGELTAAWGDPPVTLACGVPAGPATQTPLIIDGLPLVTLEAGGVVTYTTVDRAVNARIVIPKSYAEQAYLVQPLLPALKRLPKKQG